MSKITLPAVTNGQDLTNLNNNFALIAAALNTNVLYRLNVGSEANQMGSDLDFNSHILYNVADIKIAGTSIFTVLNASVAAAASSATNAANSATASAVSASAASGSAGSASTSATNAAASAALAQAIVTGGVVLLSASNLSDLASIPQAKANLALDQVSNTSDANKPLSTAATTALALKAPLVSPNFTSPNTGTVPLENDASGAIPNTLWVNAYFAKSSSLASYALLASPTFTGNVGVPTRTSGDSTANAASTNFVYATLASPQAAIGAASAVPNTSFFTVLKASGNVRVFAISAANAVAASTQTTATGWTNFISVGSGWNASTGVFTAPRIGIYRVKFRLSTATLITTSGTQIAAVIVKNGTNYNLSYAGSQGVSGLIQGVEVSALVSLAVGETILVQAFCGQAITLTGTNSTYLEIEELV